MNPLLWAHYPETIRLDLLNTLVKSNEQIYPSKFQKILNEFPNHVSYYIDASVISGKTACSFSFKDHIYLQTLKLCYHINCRIEYDPTLAPKAEIAAYSKYIILPDSLSSLRSFSDPFFSKHSVLQRILSIINVLHLSGISVVFICITNCTNIKSKATI